MILGGGQGTPINTRPPTSLEPRASRSTSHSSHPTPPNSTRLGYGKLLEIPCIALDDRRPEPRNPDHPAGPVPPNVGLWINATGDEDRQTALRNREDGIARLQSVLLRVNTDITTKAAQMLKYPRAFGSTRRE